MRIDVQNNHPIPAELCELRNEMEVLKSTLSSLNNAFLKIQSDVGSISEEGAQSRGVVQATKSTILADTTVLKGDTHTLKSKVVTNTVTTVGVQSQVNNVLETDLNISHELRILKGDVVQLHGNLITEKSDIASIRNDVLGMKAQVSSVAAAIEQLSCSLIGRHLGDLQLMPGNLEVKSNSDQGHPTTPAVSSTSCRKNTSPTDYPSQHSDTGGTESQLNSSDVTIKHTEMVTYERTRNVKEALNSPRAAKKPNPMKLFDLKDTTLEDLHMDSQETQDPTNFIADTEYTEGSHSPSIGWPEGNHLKGTAYEGAGSSIKEKKGSYVSVIDPDNPESLVPVDVVRDLQQRLSHPRESRSTCREEVFLVTVPSFPQFPHKNI